LCWYLMMDASTIQHSVSLLSITNSECIWASKFSSTLNSPRDGENEEADVGDAREAVADAVDSLWKSAVFTRSSVVFTW